MDELRNRRETGKAGSCTLRVMSSYQDSNLQLSGRKFHSYRTSILYLCKWILCLCDFGSRCQKITLFTYYAPWACTWCHTMRSSDNVTLRDSHTRAPGAQFYRSWEWKLLWSYFGGNVKTLAVRRNISSYSTGSSYTCKGNGKKQMKTNSIMLSGQRTKKITRHDGQGWAFNLPFWVGTPRPKPFFCSTNNVM